MTAPCGALLVVPCLAFGMFASSAFGHPGPQSAVELTPESLIERLLSYEHRFEDGERKDAVEALVTSWIKREEEKIRQRQEVIAWTTWTSKVGFWLAHIMVALGFLTASAEFVQAYRLRRRGRGTAETEVVVKLESLAIRTSSTGLVLLLASAAFYFMYLKYVHPIQLIP